MPPPEDAAEPFLRQCQRRGADRGDALPRFVCRDFPERLVRVVADIGPDSPVKMDVDESRYQVISPRVERRLPRLRFGGPAVRPDLGEDAVPDPDRAGVEAAV